MSVGKTLIKLGVVAGVAYGGYYVYKNFIKKDNVPQQDFEDLADVNFDYDEDAASEESFADKIKAAADRQLNRLK